MATAAGSSRRARANLEQQVAKDRRQKIYVIVLAVVLALVLAYEVPHLLKLHGGSSSTTSAPPAPPAPTTSTPESTGAASATKQLKAALLQPPRDLFTTAGGRTSGTTLGTVPTPAGLHDPFGPPGADTGLSPTQPLKPVTASPLPGTIVIGKPGAGRVAVKGWIVILASIPTANGQDAATGFADQARARPIGTVSVLNSSNRRPLRGGYWVVYTGPYSTLGQVSVAAGKVHSAGFPSAYIRELLVYKKKGS